MLTFLGRDKNYWRIRTKIQIIDALLSNWNNIEQMGTYDPSRGLEYFGEGTRIVGGVIYKNRDYVYTYEKKFRNSERSFVCNCRLIDPRGNEVRLFMIED